jgi:aspartyl/asparaginyl beta-hydroxylase (cupin superfamily)
MCHSIRMEVWVILVLICCSLVRGFQISNNSYGRSHHYAVDDTIPMNASAKGFGGTGEGPSSSSKTPTRKKKTNRLLDNLDDKPKKAAVESPVAKPYVKAEHDLLLDQLAQKSSRTAIGRAVAEIVSDKDGASNLKDPFWELIPSLISSKFPSVKDDQLHRIAGFVRHTLTNLVVDASRGIRPVDWIDDPYRPYNELHAYMPHLGPTRPFHDPSTLPICRRLQDKYETICQEYQTLLDNGMQDNFQSVTSMNYDSGWQTLVLFYNGHRIPKFPYHLCPVTTKLLESVPLAGRIAGFNRQQPKSGIPMHTDGNNMWLTCQLGIRVPDGGNQASIRVGSETQYWQAGQCLVYDTTYQHETMNHHPTQERVVLHIDFFNTLAMTPVEIEIMQYIYSLREQFMKAEGIAKVGAQVL